MILACRAKLLGKTFRNVANFAQIRRPPSRDTELPKAGAADKILTVQHSGKVLIVGAGIGGLAAAVGTSVSTNGPRALASWDLAFGSRRTQSRRYQNSVLLTLSLAEPAQRVESKYDDWMGA